jgi:tetratricopeptide (TPR) repeat protein
MNAARVALFAVVLATSSRATAGDSLDVVRRDEGYRVARPDAQWVAKELPAPAGTFHALKLERAPAPAEISFTVYLGDLPKGATTESLCAANALRWKPRATAGVARGHRTIAGEDAPSLAVDVAAFGTTVHVEQAYAVHDDVVFLVQLQAPTASFAEHEKEFASIAASLAFLPKSASRDAGRTLRALAARCGSDVPRAHTWAEASARAAKEGRFVLVTFESFRGLPVQPIADSTLFMDDDVVALCRERLVVLTWTDGLGAPFDDAAVYGLGPHTFGQGVIVATPKGEVVASLGMLEPSLVDETVRAALDARPEATGAAFAQDDPAAAMRRGDLARAETLLAAPKTADAWMLRGALMRRLHRIDAALAAFGSAAAAGADAKTVDAERGAVLLRSGRFDDATRAFRAAGDLPAARYGLAEIRAVGEGVGPVRGDLESIASGDTEDRWSWRAAALALGHGLATGAESLVWPHPSVRDAAKPRPYVASTDAARAADDAVAYLLRTQRVDGTWPAPMAFTPDPTGPVTVAVTAIAGQALLARRGRPDVDAAVALARDAVLRARGRLAATRDTLFDYTIWARVSALRFLVACAKTDVPEATRSRDVAAEIARALAADQSPGGGWSYVHLEGAGASADNSISFTTSAALLALVDARDAGIAVDPKSIARAADVVASLRRADGTWAYQTATPGIADPMEAALRGPLCALALRRAGRAKDAGDVASVASAFVARCDGPFREAGKSLCHTAPDGVAAYYMLFGLRHAAEAFVDLPKDAAARRAVVDAVLRLRRDDGSFCDFPPVGPAYGTAQALTALDLLR